MKAVYMASQFVDVSEVNINGQEKIPRTPNYHDQISNSVYQSAPNRLIPMLRGNQENH